MDAGGASCASESEPESECVRVCVYVCMLGEVDNPKAMVAGEAFMRGIHPMDSPAFEPFTRGRLRSPRRIRSQDSPWGSWDRTARGCEATSLELESGCEMNKNDPR